MAWAQAMKIRIPGGQAAITSVEVGKGSRRIWGTSSLLYMSQILEKKQKTTRSCCIMAAWQSLAEVGCLSLGDKVCSSAWTVDWSEKDKSSDFSPRDPYKKSWQFK
jgi:hypothetical protein